MLEDIIYLGVRESDCLWCNYKKSFTLFGSGKKGNIALNKLANFRYNHNNFKKNDDICNNFFISSIKKEVSLNPDAKFCYYNKFTYTYLPDELKKYIFFQPPIDLLYFLNNKHAAHKWAAKLTDSLKYYYVKGDKINYDYCTNLFNNVCKFVIQSQESSGGGETYLLSKNNENKILKKLRNNEVYSISEYKENSVSVNVHFAISNTNIILLPPSLQIIDTSNDFLEYMGCDYAAYYDTVGNAHNKITQNAMTLLKSLQQQGYRGIGGIDFLIADDKAYFMEVNARYQMSTSVLNYAFSKHNLPTVNQIDAICFTQNEVPNIFDIKVPYSKCAVTSTIGNKYPDVPSKKIFDGYTENEHLDEEVYLYTLLYKGSILNKEKKYEDE